MSAAGRGDAGRGSGTGLAGIVRGLGRPRVVVVGDLILDRYVFGTVDRISPEAPIGVLKVTSEDVRLGGAGSVARNLSVLGASVRLLGCLGAGAYGDEFLALAAAAGVEAVGTRRVAGRTTPRKTRLIARRGAGGQQVLRVDREEDAPYPEADDAALTAAALEALGDADLLVLSDYAKGTVSAGLAAAAIGRARERGLRVLVDPKVEGLVTGRYRRASAVTPNRTETARAVGFALSDPEAVRRAARRLLADLDLEAAVVTLDEDGIWLEERSGAGGSFPVVPREVYDVTGAGDMVISALAMVLAAGGGYRDAVRIANVAAGIEVGRLGVVPVSREEILEALLDGPGGKVKEMGPLCEILAARRARGDRIVFTNGCFDLLHAGHIRLLRAARAEGDLLVVGLNSDASVRRLKGAGRPVTPQDERAEVLGGLSCVDYVVLFDADTPLEAVKAVRPDVLVKGEDWRDKGVVGREEVEAGGGRVVLVPLTPGLSSTKLIERARGEDD